MKLNMPRFTVRLLMVVVAIAGVVVGSITMWNRSVHYKEQYLQNRYMRAVYDRQDLYFADGTLAYPKPKLWASDAARYKRLFDYFDSLSRKYERAAKFPWLPVAPDPPEPQ
jgi:hypothetical protein